MNEINNKYNYMNNNMNNQINMINQMFMNNNQFNTQMNMMNLMMKNFMNIVQIYNQMNKKKNENNKKNGIQIVKSNNNNKALLPRNAETVSHIAFPEIKGERVYIFFTTTAGHKVIMNVPIKVSLGDILIEYAKKVNIGPNHIGKGIHFVFNGIKFKNQDFNKTPQHFGIIDNSNILVIDTQNLLAA